MNESNEEEVSEEFKHLFQGATFKFEGLTGKTEEEYVKLVKEMGAKVSNKAQITFMQRSYFEKKFSTKGILCNIDWIADSVRERKALDLCNYILIPDPDPDDQLSDDEPLCYAARYMYKIDSCQECYYTKVFCKECAKERIKESLRAANQNRNHIISASESSSEDEIMNSPDQEAVNHSNKSSKRAMSSDSEQDLNDEEQINSSCAEKSPVKKKLKNSSNMDNTCNREESPEVDIETYSESSYSQSNDNSINNSQNKQFDEATNGISGTVHNLIEPRILPPIKSGLAETKEDDDLSDDSSDNESNAKNTKYKKSPQKAKTASNTGWITSSKPKLTVKTGPPALSEPEVLPDSLLNIDHYTDEDRYFKGDNWWIPQHVPQNEKCTIISCSFEPTDHPSHYPFRKFLSLVEKKILVKYLIIKNVIHNAKGKSIYQNMIKDGYLTHRSWETLRNCFRRTILKEIETYNLDQGLLNHFLRLRLKNNTKVKEEK